MNLKEWLDAHPLKTIAITATATGTLVAGIVIWIMFQKIDIKSDLCEKDKQALSTDHKKEIDEINWKLSALERQVGGIKKYLEVTKLLIEEENILKMKGKFQSFSNGSFYVAVPRGALWNYKLSNKLEHLSSIYGEKSVTSSATPNTINLLREQSMHVWRGHENIKIKLSLAKDHGQLFLPEELNLFPVISVQKIFLDDFVKIGSYRKNVSITNKQPEYDITALVLRQMIDNGFLVESNYENALYKIYSAQKKRNIFYIHSKLKYKNVQIPGEHGYHNITFDEETYFFSEGDRGLLVKVGIPYKEDNPKNYPFCDQWLIGLRVRVN